MKVALKRTAIATLTVACVALLSFSWSEQGGVSLGVEIAEAQSRSIVAPNQHRWDCASTIPAVCIRARSVRGRSRCHHLALALR